MTQTDFEPAGQMGDPVWSPDGTRRAALVEGRGVRVWRVGEESPQFTVTLPDGLRGDGVHPDISWSPTGAALDLRIPRVLPVAAWEGCH